MQKREQFAVSLRKKKKLEILRFKREIIDEKLQKTLEKDSSSQLIEV